MTDRLEESGSEWRSFSKEEHGKSERKNKTQKDVAEAASVTEVTIRNRYKGLKLALKL